MTNCLCDFFGLISAAGLSMLYSHPLGMHMPHGDPVLSAEIPATLSGQLGPGADFLRAHVRA